MEHNESLLLCSNAVITITVVAFQWCSSKVLCKALEQQLLGTARLGKDTFMADKLIPKSASCWSNCNTFYRLHSLYVTKPTAHEMHS